MNGRQKEEKCTDFKIPASINLPLFYFDVIASYS